VGALDAVLQATGMFAVTNVDDLVLLSLYFGRAAGDRRAVGRVVAGQYLGFGAILLVSLVAGTGVALLPATAVAYLGLVPLALGVRAAVVVWRQRNDVALDRGAGTVPVPAAEATRPGVSQVAAITFANGGDNIGVYVPVFATLGASGRAAYTVVFLVMVALWCALGHFVATRPIVARTLSRWGHILLPAVLIAIGLAILVSGGAFGL
jgi:cadmium resistance protein CadD (predicted permease)